MMKTNSRARHIIKIHSTHNNEDNRDPNDDEKGILPLNVWNVNSYSANTKNSYSKVSSGTNTSSTFLDAPMFFNQLKSKTRKRRKRKESKELSTLSCEGYNVEQRNCNMFECNGMLFT